MFQTTCPAAAATFTALTKAVFWEKRPQHFSLAFSRIRTCGAPVWAWYVPVSPESGTKTRPGPSRSRSPNYYARNSGSEAGSRFFTPKNGGEKGDEW